MSEVLIAIAIMCNTVGGQAVQKKCMSEYSKCISDRLKKYEALNDAALKCMINPKVLPE